MLRNASFEERLARDPFEPRIRPNLLGPIVACPRAPDRLDPDTSGEPVNLILISCLVVSGLGALFALAEGSARCLLRRFGRYYVWAPCARTRMEIDQSVLPMLEPTARFEINEAGERGDRLPRDFSKVYRILVAGGSATECYYIDQEASWPHVVQRALNQAQSLKTLGVDHVHVGNISRSLASASHLYRIFERVLPRYEQLDAIVLMVGASDVIRWLEHRAPAVIEDEPIPAAHVFAQHPEGPFGWRLKTLALWQIAKHWDKRLRRPIEVRERVGKRLAQCRAMRGRAKKILDVVPSPEPMLDHYEKHLRRLIQLARAHAQRVIVIRQPFFDKRFTPSEEKLMWSFGAGRPHAEEVTEYYSHAVAGRLLKQVNARTTKVAAELGVEELDIMPVLECSLDIYYDELHHTPKGCRVIGNVVARRILRRTHELESVGSLVGVRSPSALQSEKQSA